MYSLIILRLLTSSFIIFFSFTPAHIVSFPFNFFPMSFLLGNFLVLFGFTSLKFKFPTFYHLGRGPNTGQRHGAIIVLSQTFSKPPSFHYWASVVPT